MLRLVGTPQRLTLVSCWIVWADDDKSVVIVNGDCDCGMMVMVIVMVIDVEEDLHLATAVLDVLVILTIVKERL